MFILDRLFSQTRYVRERKAKGLHPVSEMHRFYILVVSYFCSISVSVVYAFDLFSETFQVDYNLSAGDLSTISTIGLVFGYFTIPYSLIFENFGPFLLFIVCCVTALIGGLCLALVFYGRIPGNTATITVFYAFLNVASGLVDTAYISTLFEIFPRNRGPVICLAKVMTSLGGSVLACIQTSFFGNNIAGFILFVMAFCMFVTLWAAFSITLPPYYMNWWRRRGKTPEELQELMVTRAYFEIKNVPIPRLAVGYVVVISLLIFFTVEAPVVEFKGASYGANIAIGVIGVVMTLLIFLMLLPLNILGPVHEPAPSLEEMRLIEERFAKEEHTRKQMLAEDEGRGGERGSSGNVSADDADHVEKPAMGGHVDEDLDHDAFENSDHYLDDADPTAERSGEPTMPVEEYEASRQDPRYQGTILRYLVSVDVWLIMLLFVCYGCTGTLVMYNGRVISVALTGKDQRGAIFTALLGVGSSVGRIAFGLFEAYVQHQDPLNRKVIVTMSLPFSPFLACLAAVLLNVLPGSAILFPYMLVYIEEGVFAGVNALIFPCLFENNHNTLYNLSFLVQCITIVCFNRAMFGVNIDKKSAYYGFSNADGCTRSECVRMPLIVAACLAFVGIFVAFAIHFRYTRFVRKERLRQKAIFDSKHAKSNRIDTSNSRNDEECELTRE